MNSLYNISFSILVNYYSIEYYRFKKNSNYFSSFQPKCIYGLCFKVRVIGAGTE